MNKIKQEYLAVWKNAYDKLNIKQQLAVDTLEGPVMTIAGPGTGKTQLLAVRIGNILLKTDVFPHNILCLTYTDAGAIAMRQRLESFIGPDAYNVSIQTFHSFCNSVIKENMQYFGDFRDLQLVSDIEEAEIYRILIDSFGDNHPLKRYKTDEYFESTRLKNLFSMMKQEKWNFQHIKDIVDTYANEILDPETSPIRWGRGGNKDGIPYKKGDFNEGKAKKEVEKYDNLLAAAGELDNYNKIMSSKERFDYQDMILWVIQKFKANDDLLGKYQERYQYILVDEYQDTNGSQNELLFLLSDFWDQPNLFIVGDDDQSIFRFQGANMNSIIDFKDKYQPSEIVLTDNYRSSQMILDSSKRVIENNNERLVQKYPYLTKELTEARLDKSLLSHEPIITEYLNETQEEVGIIKKIKDLHQSGVPYKNIAIIYTKHKTVDNLVRHFTQNKIPLNVKKRINILYEIETMHLINILVYLENELSKPHSSEDLLFEILHYDFWGLSALDIANIAIYCRKRSETDEDKNSFRRWRKVINDQKCLTDMGVKDAEKIITVSTIIENWLLSVANITIQTLIEKILTESGMLNKILADPEKSWKLQLVNTFFDFVKNEAAKTKSLSLKQLVTMINLMRDTNIELPVNRIISNENGINFMTAHGAKGLEFEHVFIIRCNKSMWEGKTGANTKYSLPPTLTSSTTGNEEEDDRRLFYVALTRARDYLYISYPVSDDKESKLETSKFISEIKLPQTEVIQARYDDDLILSYKADLMRHQQGSAQLIDGELVDKILENFKVSATSLNKYLKCKLTFYFETILRVPMARSVVMGFGNAIHYGLEQFFRDIELSEPRSMGSVSKLISFFVKGMEMYRSHFTTQEFENHIKHGENILTEYYQEYSPTWLSINKYELEYSIPSTEYLGVPISGKLDRINIYQDYISVTDYKTGKYDAKKLKGPVGEDDLGGDYWRQIIFYKLLLDGDKRHNWNMKKGIMEYIEKDKTSGKYKNQEFIIEPFEVEIVGQQLVNAYSDIKNQVFTPGCEDEKCKWCNFVRNNMPVELSAENEDNI